MPKAMLRSGVVAAAILLGLSSLGGSSLAQSEYPSAYGVRMGVGAYGQFDVAPAESQNIAASSLTEDFAEGVTAFVEKRKPTFEGR